MSKRSGRPPTTTMLRVGEDLRFKLSEILRRDDLADPDFANIMITVTEVRMSPDLRHATVFVSPLGGGDMEKTVKALRRASRHIRKLLGKSLTLRHTPDLHFHADTSFDEAEKMEALIRGARSRDHELEIDDELELDTEDGADGAA